MPRLRKTNGHAIRLRIRRRLLAADPRCAYCGATLAFATATLDHLIPRSKARGLRRNLVLACRPCNRAKGSLLPLDFIAARLDARARTSSPEAAPCP